MKPTKNDFNIFKKTALENKKNRLDSEETVAKKTVEHFRKRKKCSAYKITKKCWLATGKKERKRLKDGMFALEK